MSASTPHPTRHHRSPICLNAGRLELQFHWQADRWAHQLLFEGITYWQSLEATLPVDSSASLGISPYWPASPVFTEVSLVDTATGLALPILLVVALVGLILRPFLRLAELFGGSRRG